MRTPAPEGDKETAEWKINVVRNVIALDWAELAAKGLSSAQRKSIREHLQIMKIITLRQLIEQSRNLSVQSLGIEAVEKALGAARTEGLNPADNTDNHGGLDGKD
jgi:hypothetical protein